MTAHVLPGDAGTITIAEDVLDRIVVQAAESVDGVVVQRPRRGLDLPVADGRVPVRLELKVRYGLVLPQVAAAVQEAVRETLDAMCGLDAAPVEVTVEELE